MRETNIMLGILWLALPVFSGCSAENAPEPVAPPLHAPQPTPGAERVPTPSKPPPTNRTPFHEFDARYTGNTGPEPLWQSDIIFATPGGIELKLELARPPGAGPYPFVVCLHGGSWCAGNHEWHRPTILALARQGMAGASIDYRLAPEAQFPAQLEDARAAVRYLRENAAKFKLDPERIALLGDSAGGQLALLLGMLDSAPAVKAGDVAPPGSAAPGQREKFRCLVNFYGRSDFTVPNTWPAGTETYIRSYLGSADQNSLRLKQASAITYIGPQTPPVLTLHGAQDQLVPPLLSKRLHEKLKAAGLEEKLEIFNASGHNDWTPADRSRSFEQAFQFLAKHLSAQPAKP